MANDDNVQHGIDDNDSNDAGKGAALGGLGGAAVGAAAGSLIGPVGTLIGAAVGAISGAVASGAAVAAVDAVDNDDTVSGIGSGATGDVNTGMNSGSGTSDSYMSGAPGEHGHNIVTGDQAKTDAGAGGLTTGAVAGGVLGAALGGPLGAVVGGTAGSLIGGVAGDASEAAATGDTPGRGYTSPTATTGMTTGTTPLMGTTMDTSTSGMSAMPRVSRAEYDRLDADDRTRVQLIEEELHVGKDSREMGEVEISKRVTEEQVAVPVTLEREELIITRKAGTGGDVTGAGFTDEVISVPLREEFATVTKTAHVAEEIEIEKRVTSQETTVGGTVRREELEVEGQPQDRVHIEGDVKRNV